MKITGLCIAAAAIFDIPVYGASSNTPQENPPNVFLIVCDNLGYGFLPLYDSRPKEVWLPNIEKLEKWGMTFTDAHSAAAIRGASCYSILTGNYPWRGRETFGTWNFHAKSQILNGQKTIGDVFQQKKYHTAIFGKWQMGCQFFSKSKTDEFEPFAAVVESNKIDFSKRFKGGPLDHGYGYSFLALRGAHFEPYAFFENDKLASDANKLKILKTGKYGDALIPRTGIGTPDWNSCNLGPELTRKTIEFIDKHHKQNLAAGTQRPFFIQYDSQAIDRPCTPPEKLGNVKIKDSSLNDITDMLVEIDTSIGMFLDELQKRDMLKNTLIIFTSNSGSWPLDMSYKMMHNPNGPLRGWKGQIWEGGHRVPLVAVWGDGTEKGSSIKPNSICDQMTGLQDLYATFAELTGQKPEEGQGIDSVSFLPALLQKTSKPSRKYMVIQSNKNLPNHVMPAHKDLSIYMLHRTGPGEGAYFRALREDEWKLIVDDKGVGVALYNLKDDLQETKDLIAEPEQKDRVERMQNRYREIMKSQPNQSRGLQVNTW